MSGRSFGACSTLAAGAIAISATSAASGCWGGNFGVPFHPVIGADRLEDDVKIACAADLRAKECQVKITRAEVMNDCGLLIEQRLDVDDLQRPVLLAADSLADLISLGPKLRRAAGIFQVLSTGGTQ